MNDERKYPISEIFTSVQGEGVYAGTVMTFVRLAGCTVGKSFPKEMYESKEEMTFVGLEDMPPKFPIYTEECTLYDGRKFACDTDYRVKSRLTADEIASHIPPDVNRVCITGGEPCMHDISFLLPALADNGKRFIHLETSGTIYFGLQPVWVTVSPKKGILTSMLNRADELKFLVDENFNPEEKYYSIGPENWYEGWDAEMSNTHTIGGTAFFIPSLAKKKPVFLHPVNFEHSVNGENVKRCRYWQNKYRQFRIGLQLHKVIEHYTKERVL